VFLPTFDSPFLPPPPALSIHHDPLSIPARRSSCLAPLINCREFSGNDFSCESLYAFCSFLSTRSSLSSVSLLKRLPFTGSYKTSLSPFSARSPFSSGFLLPYNLLSYFFPYNLTSRPTPPITRSLPTLPLTLSFLTHTFLYG